MERFNNVVGQENLFKRSLVLIKLWIFNESKRLSYLGERNNYTSSVYLLFLTRHYHVYGIDLSELFRHDVLVVITMMIFATGRKSSYYVLLQEAAEADAQKEIDHPLTALICFLEIFSEIDWTASRVSATGVLPSSATSGSRPFDFAPSQQGLGDGSSGGIGGVSGGAGSILAQLEFILDDHRRFFADNFEAAEPSMQQEDMNGEFWDSYILPAPQPRLGHRNAPVAPPKAKLARPVEGELAIFVVDPFSRGRNLCSSCPSSFRREGVLQHLQTVFYRGLMELSALVDTPLKSPEGAAAAAVAAQDLLGAPEKKLLRNERDILSTVFPWTYSLLRSRREELPSCCNLASSFRAVCFNAPSLSSGGAHPSDISARFREAMLNVENMISLALQISSKKVTYL